MMYWLIALGVVGLIVVVGYVRSYYAFHTVTREIQHYCWAMDNGGGEVGWTTFVSSYGFWMQMRRRGYWWISLIDIHATLNMLEEQGIVRLTKQETGDGLNLRFVKCRSQGL